MTRGELAIALRGRVPAARRTSYIMGVYDLAGRRHAPPALDVEAVLFRATASTWPTCGWAAEEFGRLAVEAVPGDHLSIVRNAGGFPARRCRAGPPAARAPRAILRGVTRSPAAMLPSSPPATPAPPSSPPLARAAQALGAPALLPGKQAAGAAAVTAGGREALEVLRLAAVGLLVAYHAVLLAPEAPGLLHRGLVRLGGIGSIGTDLLLALAGFLAGGSRARAPGALAWLGRRAARTLPALFAFLAVYLYLVPPLLALAGASPEALQGFAQARRQQGYLWTLSTNLLMVAGGRPGAALEPLLTLGLGAQLTLLAALVLGRRDGRVAVGGLALVAGLGFALRLAWLGADPWLPYSVPFTRCEGFAGGAVVAALLGHPRWRAAILHWRFRLLGAAAAALAVMAALTHGLSVHSGLTVLAGYPVVGVFSAAVALTLSQARAGGAWSARLAAAAGMAYGVYLVKLPAVYLAQGALERLGLGAGTMGLLLLLGLGLLASALLGLTLHAALEQPLRAALRRATGPAPSRGPSPGPST